MLRERGLLGREGAKCGKDGSGSQANAVNDGNCRKRPVLGGVLNNLAILAEVVEQPRRTDAMSLVAWNARGDLGNPRAFNKLRMFIRDTSPNLASFHFGD